MDSVWRWSPLGNGEGKDTLIYINICLNIWHTLTNEYLSSYFIDRIFYLFGFDNSILSLQGFKKKSFWIMVTFYKIVLHAMVILVFESEESTSDRWWDIAIAVNVPGPFLLEGGASGRDQ